MTFGFLLFAVGLVGCATTSPVVSDYNPEQDFSQFTHYQWIEETSERSGEGAVSPLVLSRVRDAIEADLSAKGFTLANASDKADFLVAFTIGVENRVDTYNMSSSFLGDDDDESSLVITSWGESYYREKEIVDTYSEGSLAIDVFNAQTRSPVWHGYASKRLEPEDLQDDGGVSINTGVRAILATFPPQ